MLRKKTFSCSENGRMLRLGFVMACKVHLYIEDKEGEILVEVRSEVPK